MELSVPIIAAQLSPINNTLSTGVSAHWDQAGAESEAITESANNILFIFSLFAKFIKIVE